MSTPQHDENLRRLARAARELEDDLHEQIGATRLARRARFVQRARSRDRAPRRWAWAAAAFGAAAVVLLVLLLRPSGLRFEIKGDLSQEASQIAADARSVAVEFSDGSSLEVQPHGRASVGVGEDRARVRVEQGSVSLHVNPRTDARWQVDAGPYRVSVTGTVFTVRWQPDGERIEVSVSRGSVRVEGPDVSGARVVSAGEEFVGGGDGDGDAVIAKAEVDVEAGTPEFPEAEDPPVAATPERPAPMAASKRARGASPSRWRSLAGEGRYAEALAEAEAIGLSTLCKSAQASELARLADVARYASNAAQARRALDCLRRRFPRSSAARRAAYTRGRVEFDLAKNFNAAARWFDTYLAESPQGALRKEALGRAIESLAAAGRRASAKTKARQYLDAYPDGPHADVARRLLR